MRSNATLILIAVAALFVGVLIGYFVAPEDGGGTDSERSERRQVPESGRQESSNPRDQSRSDPVAARRSAVDGTDRQEDGVAARAVSQEPAASHVVPAELVQELTAPFKKREGNGQITGRVVWDGTGEGVEGVLVSAGGVPKSRLESRFSNQRPVIRTMPEPDLAESALAHTRMVRRNYELYHSTITNADGSFELTGLPEDAEYMVTARADGMDIHELDDDGERMFRRSGYTQVGSVLTFTAKRRYEVVFDVLMPDGTPAAMMRLEYRPWPRNAGDADPEEVMKGLRNYGGTGGNGDGFIFAREPGEYVVCAYDAFEDSYLVGAMRSKSLRIDNREAIHEKVTLQLFETPSIMVKADIGSSRRVSYRYKVALCSDVAELQEFRKLERAAESLAEFKGGRVALFRDLTPGKHFVALLDTSTNTVASYQEVIVTQGLTHVELAPKPLDRDQYAVVWIRGPDGQLLKDVTLTQGYRTSNSTGQSGGSQGVSVHPDGSWHVPHPDLGNQKDVKSIVLWAVSEELGVVETEYQIDPEVVLNIQFAQPSFLTVALSGLNLADEPQELRATWKSQDISRAHYSESNPVRVGHTFRFGPTQPGNTQVTVTCIDSVDPRGYRNLVVLAERVVSLYSGDNSLTIEMPVLTRLEVSISGSITEDMSAIASSIVDKGATNFLLYRMVGSDGRAIFEGLPPGKYRVYSSDRSVESTTVEVPRDRVVALGRKQ